MSIKTRLHVSSDFAACAGMLYFRSGWESTVVQWEGTSFQANFFEIGLMFIYANACYSLEALYDLKLGMPPSKLFATLLSFLVVFRSNNSFQRYTASRKNLHTIFHNLREYIGIGILSTGSGAKLKGSVGEGPNQTNYSDRSSVRILSKITSGMFARKFKKFRKLIQNFNIF